MIQTLKNNWRLLALCGMLEVILSAIYLIMQQTDGPVAFHSWNATIALLGKLALVAGACAIAAGMWRPADGRCWLLVLHGVALGALGVIQTSLVRFRISFLTVALLVILMATSLGILELRIARTLRRGGWIMTLAGTASVGFAVAFLALGLRWMTIERHADLAWLSAYFGLSAISMAGLVTLRRHREQMHGSR